MPFALMIAGPNGSGKTSLTRWLRQHDIEFGEYINPDDIASELFGTYDARVAEAQTIADRRREACIAARRSFSFETVMSHPSKVDILVRAGAAGFFAQLFFVGNDDPQLSVERVALRVAQGGHDVPTDKIIARWSRSMELLSSAIRSADEASVFDNSAAGNVDLRRLIIHSRLEAGLPKIQQFPPMPNWVRRYVLEPLGVQERREIDSQP
jgi:predicted ABC-type ATPase